MSLKRKNARGAQGAGKQQARPGRPALADLKAAYAQAGQALEARQFQRVLELTAPIVEAIPNHVDALHLRALALFRLERREAALASVDQALAIQSDFVEGLNTRGLILAAMGRLDAALSSLRHALEERPDFFIARHNLGKTLREAERSEEALVPLEQVLAQHPDAAETHFERAVALWELRRIDAALAALEPVLRLQPNRAGAHAAQAVMLEFRNHPEAARAAAERALVLDPANVDAPLALAMVQRRAGDFDGALAALKAVPEARLGGADRMRFQFELGAIHDRRGDPERAFRHFREANRLCGRRPAYQRQDTQAIGVHIDRLTRYLERPPAWADPAAAAKSNPAAPPDDQRADPIFLVGFPRSGTTLLEHILDAHPRLDVLGERLMLLDVRRRLEATAGYPAGLDGLSPAALADLRRLFFERVEQELGRPPQGIIVDKLPLEFLDSPLIHRLFPRARFLFAMRHPCDAALSCFFQNFAANWSTVHFLSLEGTARLYDQVMRFWALARQALPLTIHEIRYERLTADMAGEIRAALDFLDLPWDDAVLDFHNHNQARETHTPSYHQVVQPVNSQAVARWRRYQARFDAVRPLLESHVEACGYGPWEGDGARDGD